MRIGDAARLEVQVVRTGVCRTWLKMQVVRAGASRGVAEGAGHAGGRVQDVAADRGRECDARMRADGVRGWVRIHQKRIINT